MSRLEKAIERIKRIPNDYTYKELKSLLEQLGFQEFNKGRTSGSRVKYYRDKDKRIINVHKPHPGSVLTIGAVKDIVRHLRELGEI